MLKVGVLCSSRAPGLAELLTHPGRGGDWNITCVVTSATSIRERDLLRAARVPLVLHPIHDFLAERGAALSDLGARRDYDAATAAMLRDMGVDVVVLLGYLYVLTPQFLRPFEGRVINLHDSDLSEIAIDGEPRFVGLHSTRDAIATGAAETRSSLHVVTERLDAGPVIAVSDPYPVAAFARDAARAGHDDIVRAYAYAQREWMMRDSWGSMVAGALEAFARDGAFLGGSFDEKAAPRAPHSTAALARRERVAVSA